MENKTSFHKFMDATSGVKVDLSALEELKALQNQFNTASQKAQSALNSANAAMNNARKIATDGVTRANLSIKAANDLGINQSQFDGWVKQFEQDKQSLESAMQLIGKIMSLF